MSLDVEKLISMGQKALDLEAEGKVEEAEAIREELEEIRQRELNQLLEEAPPEKKLPLQALDARTRGTYSHLKSPLARAAKASEHMLEGLDKLNEALAPFRGASE